MADSRANDKRRPALGLRKIATLQTLAGGAKPRHRHELANRFARLENERARLERELGIWENCRQATALRLAKVDDEIAVLRPALFPSPARRAVLRQGHGRRRAQAGMQVSGSRPPHNRAMTLEY